MTNKTILVDVAAASAAFMIDKMPMLQKATGHEAFCYLQAHFQTCITAYLENVRLAKRRYKPKC